MADILCIESSAKNCSVAWSLNGVVTDIEEKSAETYSHAEDLHVFIDRLVKKAGKIPDAIAVSKGPGSYTGLRIGVSAAKGLCFSWNVPLIAIGTLDALAHYGATHFSGHDLILPMIDARRMEVYCAQFSAVGSAISPVEAVVLDISFFEKFSGKKMLILGDGAAKTASLVPKNSAQTEQIFPSAMMLGQLADEKFGLGEFENLAYFEPYYLKEFLPGISNKDFLKRP